eukprot:11970136-Ditylum_brightwellii.AAC.1
MEDQANMELMLNTADSDDTAEDTDNDDNSTDTTTIDDEEHNEPDDESISSHQSPMQPYGMNVNLPIPFHLSQPNLEVHFGSGKAEYPKQYKPFIAMYSDADLARESRESISTTSIVFLTNGVATHWDISKQGKPTRATTSAELFALNKGVLK